MSKIDQISMSITDEQIGKLRNEAGEAGDEKLVTICGRALAGDKRAVYLCAVAIRDAAAQVSP